MGKAAFPCVFLLTSALVVFQVGPKMTGKLGSFWQYLSDQGLK